MESRKEPGRNRIPGGRKPASTSGTSRPARSENDGFSGNADRAYARKKSEGSEGERPRGRSKMVSKDYSPRPERDSDSNRERPNRSGGSFSRDSKPAFGPRKTGFNRSDRSDDRPRRSFSDGERRSAAGRPARPDSDNRSERPSRYNSSGQDRPAPRRSFGERSSEDRPFRPKPGFKKPFGSRDSEDRPFRPKPGFKKPFGSRDSEDRPFRPKPGFKKPFGSRDSDDRGDRPRPFAKREGFSSDRGERPRPYPKRDASSGEQTERPLYTKKPYGARTAEGGEKRSSRFSRDSDARPAFKDSKPRPAFNKDEASGEERPKRTYTKRSGEDGETRPARSPRSDYKTSRPGKTFGHNRKPRPAEGEEDGPKGVRLNKYLANAGLCSRREADQFIQSGVVEVNGETITELGHKIQHDDVVLFGGKRVNGDKPTYVLLNKPKDYITTTRDPEQRKTVMELVSSLTRSRVFPVGRLDRNTTGVLMLTNDGELADRLLHPSRKISKVYHVEVDKRFKIKDLKALKTGIELEDGIIQVDDVSLVEGGTPMQIGIQIHSGRNRIVRRMIEHLGYQVIKLDRVMFAGLTKKGLKRGQARFLTEEEVIMLRRQ